MGNSPSTNPVSIPDLSVVDNTSPLRLASVSDVDRVKTFLKSTSRFFHIQGEVSFLESQLHRVGSFLLLCSSSDNRSITLSYRASPTKIMSHRIHILASQETYTYATVLDTGKFALFNNINLIYRILPTKLKYPVNQVELSQSSMRNHDDLNPVSTLMPQALNPKLPPLPNQLKVDYLPKSVDHHTALIRMACYQSDGKMIQVENTRVVSAILSEKPVGTYFLAQVSNRPTIFVFLKQTDTQNTFFPLLILPKKSVFKLALSLQGSSSVLLSDINQVGEALKSVTFLNSVHLLDMPMGSATGVGAGSSLRAERISTARAHNCTQRYCVVEQIFKRQYIDAVV